MTRFPHCREKKFEPQAAQPFHGSFWLQCLIVEAKQLYTETLLHTKSAHRDAFTPRRCYTQSRWHNTQTLLHTDAFTHRPFYTETLLHTEACTHRPILTSSHRHVVHTDRERESERERDIYIDRYIDRKGSKEAAMTIICSSVPISSDLLLA